MSLLDQIFEQQESSSSPEHGVIIHFQYGKENLTLLHELESKLEHVLKGKSVGDYDGHDIAIDYSDGFLYLYGENAERLFKEIEGTLKSTDFMSGANVKLRFGPPEEGVSEIELTLGKKLDTLR